MQNTQISHRQRMEICLSGEKPDMTPVSFWRHFPVDDQKGETLAKVHIDYQNRFDFDFIKISPSSSFCIRDWGTNDVWQGHYHGTRDYLNHVIQKPEDWIQLAPLDPSSGAIHEHLDCARILKKEISKDIPIIQTVFSPLAQAKNLVGKQQLSVHIRNYPDAVHAGLRTITETTLRFIDELKNIGIDGIFYAVQHAQYGLFSEKEFVEFGRQYDLQVFEQKPTGFWLNIGHIHGQNVMFDMVKDYPVEVLNWHDRETLPDLKTAKDLTDKVLCGGLKQEETMILGNNETVTREALDAIQQTNGEKFILGTGCVTPTTAPYGNIISAINAARKGK